jgi:hypothetical protein
MRAEVLKGHLDGLLLATLEAGPRHGYAVMEALRAGSGGRFDLPTGTVYPALHRLERAGLVLAAGLAGPRPVRAAIVAEVADGLTETTAAHQRSGLAPAAAAGAAVAEFGGARLIAAGFGPELAAETGRRIGLGLLATGPLVGSAWLGSCRSIGPATAPTAAGLAAVLCVAGDLLLLAGLVAWATTPGGLAWPLAVLAAAASATRLTLAGRYVLP